jgi:hypothetical protein
MKCSCGAGIPDGEEFTDHLLQVFSPEDGIAADGKEHLEGAPGYPWTCLCGHSSPNPEGLDAHFLETYVPADRTVPDGTPHQPA